MSTMYERIDELCKRRGINVTEMCRELKIGRSSLSELSRGRSKTLSSESTSSIADYFNVSSLYLTKGIPEEIAKDYVEYEIRDDTKDGCRNNMNNTSFSLEERVDSAIFYLQCLFSTSYENQGYNPNHIKFADYVPLILGQKYFETIIPADVYNLLIIKYGKKIGMREGTIIASIEGEEKQTINPSELRYAAYQELEGEPDEVVNDVINFIKFTKSQRKNNQ